MRPLSPTLGRIALEELNETPDRIQQDLIILRVWISQQAHLTARTDDNFLIAFLRRSRYSLEETKKGIERFFACYNFIPEVLGRRSVNQKILDINRSGVHIYPEFPKCDNKAFLLVRLGQYNPIKCPIRDFLSFISMAFEIMALENDNATVAGLCQIVDFEGADMENWRQQELLKRWFYWFYACCPIRVKEVFILNAPREMHIKMSIYRSITSWQSAWQLEYPVVHMIKNMEELYQHVPKKCLPEEYGGSNSHFAECIAYMEDLLKSYRDYFDEDHKYGISEALRSGDVPIYEAEFGANGSFRKLEEE